MDPLMPVINPHQFGSLRGSSTVHALVELIQSWHRRLDSPGKMIRVLMIDFSKAFDRVGHFIILWKLASLHGSTIANFLMRWLTLFLCQRQQRTKIGQHTSDWCVTSKQVYQRAWKGPQSTLCGPVAFLTHISDLQTCNILKYVYDYSIWEVCTDDGYDSEIQQAAKWSSNNLMKVNMDKTREMVITFSKKHPTRATVFVNSNAIERVTTFKLLGVMLWTDLSWGLHVDYLYGKRTPRLYLLTLLKRAGVAPSDTLRIYTSMIRSVFEYVCAIWHILLTKEQSDKLESIQKRALRTIFPDKPYSKALSTLCMDTLKQRREDACKSCSSKTCRNQTTNPTTTCPISKTHVPYASNERYPRPKAKTDRYKNSFLPLCSISLAVIAICFALLGKQRTENLSKSGQPKTIVSTIYSDVM